MSHEEEDGARLMTVVDGMQAEIDRLRAENEALRAAARGELHPSWETQPREQLLEALRFQGAMTRALLDSQERLSADIEALRAEIDRLHVEKASLRAELPTDAERAVLAAAKAQEAAREELAQLPRCHHSIVTWCPNCDVLRSARRAYDDAAKLLMRSPRAAYGKERG